MDSKSELLPKNGVLQLCRTVVIHPHLTDVKLKLCIIHSMGREKIFSVMQAELARCVVCCRWGQVKEPFVADHCCLCKTWKYSITRNELFLGLGTATGFSVPEKKWPEFSERKIKVKWWMYRMQVTDDVCWHEVSHRAKVQIAAVVFYQKPECASFPVVEKCYTGMCDLHWSALL